MTLIVCCLALSLTLSLALSIVLALTLPGRIARIGAAQHEATLRAIVDELDRRVRAPASSTARASSPGDLATIETGRRADPPSASRERPVALAIDPPGSARPMPPEPGIIAARLGPRPDPASSRQRDDEDITPGPRRSTLPGPPPGPRPPAHTLPSMQAVTSPSSSTTCVEVWPPKQGTS